MAVAIPDPEYVLRGVAGRVFGRSYHLLSPTTVGRSPECDICLDDPGISRVHARLRPIEGGVEVEDLHSTNGCFLNGQRLTLGIARVGDEIAFDQSRFRLGGVPREQHSMSGEFASVGRVPSRARKMRWAALAAMIAGGAVAALVSSPWLAGMIATG